MKFVLKCLQRAVVGTQSRDLGRGKKQLGGLCAGTSSSSVKCETRPGF